MLGYGRRTSAAVSVGRAAASRAPMAPHTPLAHMPGYSPANHNHVKVGDAGCPTCGVDTHAAFNDTQKAAWGQGCGPGEKRRPLGTTRSEVTAGASETFLFSSLVPFKSFWLSIPDDIASDFTITSLQFGLNQIIIGGEVPAATFNSRNGQDCADMFEGCIIYPSIPAQLVVRNDSLENLFFNASMMGAALIQC